MARTTCSGTVSATCRRRESSLFSTASASPATLRRRLSEEGESYQSILDELRRDLAIALLGETSLSVAAIAIELGFAESSAFHRAFKKWTGASPGEYRRGAAAGM